MVTIDRHSIDRQIKRALPRATYAGTKQVYYRARELAGRNPGRGHLLPDFLIIGAVKAGTTSLHGWLTMHPFVAPAAKEIHFFDLFYGRGSDWYRTHFPTAAEQEAFVAQHGRPFLSGEGTASYLTHLRTPERLARLAPQARLIVILRDPVDRAHSQYHYFRRRGSEEHGSFEAAIDAEASMLAGEEERERADPHYHSVSLYRRGLLRSGRYAEHLERWLAHFPRRQFLLIAFERELVRDPAAALARVGEFLGLPRWQPGPLEALNTGRYDPMAPTTRERLVDYFAPHNRRLYELTGIDFGWPA